MNQNNTQEPLFTTGITVDVTISNSAIIKLISAFAICVCLYFLGLLIFNRYGK
jgi:hypothetical protein